MTDFKEIVEQLNKRQLEDLRNAKTFDEEIRIQQAYNIILTNVIKEAGKINEQN